MKHNRSDLPHASTTSLTDSGTVSRRAFLGAAAAVALPLVVGTSAAHAVLLSQAKTVLGVGSPPAHFKHDIYAFHGHTTDRCVLAVTVRTVSDAGFALQARPAAVTFRTRDREWPVGLAGADARPDYDTEGAHRAFSGFVQSVGNDRADAIHAVVLELPIAEVMANNVEEQHVWAEIRLETGQVLRAGNPFASHLARGGAVSNPPRAAQLARHDGLSFKPGQPVGFTYADQNGRHPADHVDAVVDTLLFGRASDITARSALAWRDMFPYFVPATLAA
ncbi:protein of unknown function [Pararobbsia alpina]|uniref:hypothetical protein n=1 Tax=Pararobbsia alpina TaxID=621374 RepID=UPI0039A67532